MRALALIEATDHVCGRYRLLAFATALAEAGWSLTVEGLEQGAIGRLRQLHRARDYDTVVLQRKLLPAWQVVILRRQSRRLLFDFDDAVLYRDSNDPRGPRSTRRESRFSRLMQCVDGVIAGNDYLADLALQHGARSGDVRVIPTCIQIDKYKFDEARRPRELFDLTWIGSSSTLRGLESQRAIWERVGREIPGSRLRLICDRFPRFEHLEVLPVVWNETTEVDELAKADVGVSWIPDGLWSRGKCGLKVLQYQAAGLPVVANPVGVHPKMIQHGETGFLATTADDWIEALRTLHDSPDARSTMGNAARRSVERHYSIKAWAPTFLGSLAGHAQPPAPKSCRSTPVLSGRSPTEPATGMH